MKGPQIEGLDRETLTRLYVNDEKASLENVAAKLGCNRETIRRWLRRYDLPIKPRYRYGAKKPENAPLADKSWLESELQDKTVTQIADELGTTIHDVWYWSRKHNLADMSRSEAIRRGLAKRFPEGRYGAVAGRWSGGRTILQSGYVYVYAPDHPNSTKSGYIMEHRLVMEQVTGRPLTKNEVVHHRDGDKLNNSPENLVVKKRGQHLSDHFSAGHEVIRLREEVKELRAALASTRHKPQETS